MLSSPLKVDESASGGVRRAAGKVFSDRAAVSGEDEVGCDFIERGKDEEALADARMGEDEAGGVCREMVEGDEVNVEGAGLIGLGCGAASEGAFDGLALAEEAFRAGVAGKGDLESGVGKGRGTGRAMNWCGDPGRRKN